jgi:hypothetical protein
MLSCLTSRRLGERVQRERRLLVDSNRHKKQAQTCRVDAKSRVEKAREWKIEVRKSERDNETMNRRGDASLVGPDE